MGLSWPEKCAGTLVAVVARAFVSPSGFILLWYPRYLVQVFIQQVISVLCALVKQSSLAPLPAPAQPLGSSGSN